MLKNNSNIELLSPARDMEQLIMSLTYGANAVYLGGQNFGLRASAGNFAPDALREAVQLCRTYDAKVYVTCNAVLNNDEINALPSFLEETADAGVDAFIVSDLGVLSLVKKHAPTTDIHISTQAGVMNYETAKLLHDLGASRIILARELTLPEIAQIRENTPPELELESFVHGAMCVSFSGRCLLSNYMTKRDANRGACAQPCRWKYHLIEEQRPGEYWEITEDGGTYIMNSRDMCLIDHIKPLIDAGITGLKIEGRMKSAYYAGVVTNAYRKAIDAAIADLPLPDVWRNEVNKVSHREYSTGFYFDASGPGEYNHHGMYYSDCIVTAIVESCDNDKNAVLSQRNKFEKGDELELLTPNDEPVRFVVESMRDMNGNEMQTAPHPMMEFHVKLPIVAPKYSILRKYK